MKTYQGTIDFNGNRQVQVIQAGTAQLLLCHGVNNRQENYSWGQRNYDLAYDILWDAVGEEGASNCYDDFAREVIKRLDGEEGFTMSYYDVKQFVDDHTPPTSEG